ncbi:hypothetical protein Tco_0971919 [Tanacetum coccineum]
MDKRKRYKLTLEIFKDIFKIFPRVQGQDFDALPTDEEIVSFLRELGHTGEINSLNDVTTGLDKLCLSRAQILWDLSLQKEATQIYGVILLESLTSPEMKETKAYKTYLVSLEEPSRKSKRVKRPTKKSTKATTGGVVIRETHEMSLSKKKEKMTVEKRKGIDLLFEVALTEEARKKSLRDFHKTHPSGSGTVTKIAPSAAKIKPSIPNEGTCVKLGVPNVIEEESTESEAESWGNDEDDNNNDNNSESEGSDEENETDDKKNEEEMGDDEEEEEDEFVKTPSNDSHGEDETKITNKDEDDEDKEMDYTTSQLYDDVDIRLNKPVQADDETFQKEGTDAEMISKIEVPITSSSHSSDLAAKFLNFADIPTTEAEIVSPMDVHSFTPPPLLSPPTLPPTIKATNPQSALPDFASVFQFNNRVTTLEKDVSELKKDDPLKTQVTVLVDKHLDARLRATRDEFIYYLSAAITARIIEQVKNQLPQILPKEVSNFAPSVIQSMIIELLEQAVLAKESSQPQSSNEAAASLTEFELKNILINKMDKNESYLAAPEHRECYDGLIKSYDLDKSLFSTYDKVYSLKRSQKDIDKDEDPSTGSD